MERLKGVVSDDLLNYIEIIKERVENLIIDIENISCFETIHNALVQLKKMNTLSTHISDIEEKIDVVFQSHEKQIDVVCSQINTWISQIKTKDQNFYIDV